MPKADQNRSWKGFHCALSWDRRAGLQQDMQGQKGRGGVGGSRGVAC